jgi:hypothetical protein
MAGGAKAAHRSDRVLNGHDYERHAWGPGSYEWDPWGHWGARTTALIPPRYELVAPFTPMIPPIGPGGKPLGIEAA